MVIQVSGDVSQSLNIVEEFSNIDSLSFSKLVDLTEVPDVIIVGCNDGGTCESTFIDKLLEFRKLGSTIIFCHDEPKPLKEAAESFVLENFKNFEDSEESTIYKAKLTSMGITALKSEDYIFFNKARVKIEGLYGLPDTIAVVETHTNGIELGPEVSILIDNPSVPEGRTNWYLAELVEDELGRVVFWNYGHNQYGKLSVQSMTESEKVILAKLTVS